MQSIYIKSDDGAIQHYLLEMLREVIAISEAEQKSTRSDAGCNCNEQERPKPQGNTRHDEAGYLALMGYCK